MMSDEKWSDIPLASFFIGTGLLTEKLLREEREDMARGTPL